MANITKKEQLHYVELKNAVVDFTSGDVLVFDNVKDISPLYPLNPLTALIVLCTKGHQKVQASKMDVVLGENQLLVCPPSISMRLLDHSIDFECKVVCISEHLVRIMLRDNSDVLDRSLFTNQLTITQLQADDVEELGIYFTLVRSKLKHVNPTAPCGILLALLRAMLMDMCFKMEKTPNEKRDHKLSQGKILFNRFLTLISNNRIKRQPISTYASQLAITPKYLTMLCLKYSNKTASEWVAQYTLEEIRFYLKNTELSIKEISVHMGFSNMSHFGSYVRKHLGMSPSEYRYSKKI